MPRKRKPRRLSAGEIEILEFLWREGGVTIAGAHEALGRRVGYTTVQTRLNRMVKKGTVARSNNRPALYSAAVASEDVSAENLDMLLEQVSGGRVVPLVAHLVRDRSLSREEIRELKQLIREAERKTRDRRSPEESS